MTRARVDIGDDVAAVAKAVADPTRLALLRHIQVALAPVGVHELAEHFQLHANAVRQHLAHLRDAGLLIEEPERTGLAGRPRLAYRPDPERAFALARWNPYEFLAQLLVEVATGASARDVGARYGRELADAAPEDTALGLLTGIARRHGFQPTVEVADDHAFLVLGRCPFAASVTGDRIVCELHRGMADGIASTRDGAEVISLEFAPPATGGCRFDVRLTTKGAS